MEYNFWKDTLSGLPYVALFAYYIVSMCVGISTMEDMKTNELYKNKSSAFKIWYWLFFVFIYTQLILTPFKVMLFILSFKKQRVFLGILKYHTKGTI